MTDGDDKGSAAMRGSVDDPATQSPPTFENELRALINRHGMERFSNTPDWVLARLLVRMLDAYASAVHWIRPCDQMAISPGRRD